MNSLPRRSDPQCLSEDYPNLWGLVEKERIALYTGTGLSESIATDYELNTAAQEAMLGRCTLNSTEMAARLSKNGYEPIIALGYLGGKQGNGEPACSVRSTYFHAWVEIEDSSSRTGYLVVEPVSEFEQASGFPYISPERPPTYYVNDKSRFWWEPWMDKTIVGVESRLDEFRERAEIVD